MKYITKKHITTILGDLVKIHSPYLEEDMIMEYTYKLLKELNLEPQMHHYFEKELLNYDGKNVYGIIKGKQPGPTIYLNGHLDTVHICKGWTTDPLRPTIIDDKMYGLGTLDMKSGVVAIILAIKEFISSNDSFNGTIIYSFVSDEEGPYGLGTDAFLNNGLANTADIAIITEPSSGFNHVEFPCLSLGARGGYAYDVEFFGKSAHGANPELGISAIVDASTFVKDLKSKKLTSDGTLGTGSNCVVGINGGGATCSVADYAKVNIFRHINSEENKETIVNEVKSIIQNNDFKTDYKINFRQAPTKHTQGFMPYVTDESHEYSQKFMSSIKKVSKNPLRLNYFSSIGDFNYIGSRLKIPTFIFGPSGENYHSANEFVYISSVLDTSKVLYHFFDDLLK